MNDTILELKNVNKSFMRFALNDISFSLPRGFIMGFIGSNGSGKTTIIKLILNMLSKETGAIRIFGLDNSADEAVIKDKIGVVMDDYFYMDNWTPNDIQRIIKPFYSNWDTEKYFELLERFLINPRKSVKSLSKGMKMKLSLACALSHNAELLILDEPTSGLDAIARAELLEILSSFVQNENNAVLFSTHMTTDLEKIADYITFINNGQIIYSDTKDNLLEQYIIAKGGLGILSQEHKRLIIGYKEHNTGFEGLVDKKHLSSLPKMTVFDKCALDDIITYFNFGGKDE